MGEFQIKRAERSQAFLRLAFTGASFAGKTTASLLLAKGIVDAMVAAGKLSPSQTPRIGVIDTERRSAQLYAHLTPFDTIELGPPYSIARYLGALKALEDAKYPIIIIDQISHAWAGQGGVLQSMKGEGNWSEWKKQTPIHDEFIDSILRSPGHIIVTMRSKTEWVLEDTVNKRGEATKSPRRIGMAPIQRPGVEYEFTTLLDLQINGTQRSISVQKDRTGVFTDLSIHRPEDWGKAGQAAVQWLLSGAVAVGNTDPAPQDQAEALCAAAERLLPRQANMPDLARTFEDFWRRMKEFAPALGADNLAPLQSRIMKAKDDRKAELSTTRPALGADVAVVTPDDVDTIDALLMLGGVFPDDFKQEFGVARIAVLPYDAYEEAITWVIKTAGAAGIELSRPTRVSMPTPEKVPLKTAKEIVNRLGAEKSANDLLAPQP